MMRFRVIPFLVALLLSAPVQAQDKVFTNPCAFNREVIAGMGSPRYTYPVMWDAAYGQLDHHIQFFSALPVEDGNVLALGRSMNKTTLAPDKIVLVRLNRRGRVITLNEYPAKGWELPVKLLKSGDGFAVLSDIRKDKGLTPWQSRVVWYGKDGKFKAERVFQDARYAIESTTMIGDKTGFTVLLHAVGHKPSTDEYSSIARLSSGGALVWRRDYRPGPRNMLLDIEPAHGGGTIAVGRIENDGRPSGWMIVLDDKGRIITQHTYMRGGYAMLNRAAAMTGGGYAMAGSVQPADQGRSALWVMTIDESGDPDWQRFYRRGDTAYSAAGISVQPDQRIVVMANARPDKMAGQKNHIRLITLSPLGMMIGDEAYIKGEGSKAFDMVPGWTGERLIAASIDTGREGETGLQYQGWIIVATALDKWIDACAKVGP